MITKEQKQAVIDEMATVFEKHNLTFRDIALVLDSGARVFSSFVIAGFGDMPFKPSGQPKKEESK